MLEVGGYWQAATKFKYLWGHICGVRSCNRTASLGSGWEQGQSNVRNSKT